MSRNFGIRSFGYQPSIDRDYNCNHLHAFEQVIISPMAATREDAALVVLRISNMGGNDNNVAVGRERALKCNSQRNDFICNTRKLRSYKYFTIFWLGEPIFLRCCERCRTKAFHCFYVVIVFLA